MPRSLLREQKKNKLLPAALFKVDTPPAKPVQETKIELSETVPHESTTAVEESPTHPTKPSPETKLEPIESIPQESTTAEEVKASPPPKAPLEPKTDAPSTANPRKSLSHLKIGEGKQVSGLSISSIQYKKKAAQQANKEIQNREIREKDIDPEELQKLWIQLKDRKKRAGESNILALMEMGELEFTPPFQLSIEVPNSLNKTELSRAFEEFLPVLKDELENDKIEIRIEVSPEIKTEHIFTLEEKLKRLQEINPAIVELQKALDLNL